jgi:hypothetical protein
LQRGENSLQVLFLRFGGGLKMSDKDHYFVFMKGDFQKVNLWKLARYCRDQESEPMIWSARLSTGFIGFTNCESRKREPSGYNEVILAVGDEGLSKLGELGFIPCPECHPEEAFGFWGEGLEEVVKNKYDINSPEGFASKKRLPADPRRLNWEELLPMIGKAPNRIYLGRGLGEDDLLKFKERFESVGIKLPPVGYKDRKAPERFSEYPLH